MGVILARMSGGWRAVDRGCSERAYASPVYAGFEVGHSQLTLSGLCPDCAG